jgi:radical SAM superfamily enzyme YgiQ (UPF0313 family)
MGKNILLVNPWIHDFAAYDFWLKPMGLLYLGGLLRANNHRVSYIDCLDPYSPEMTQKHGKSPKRHPFGHGRFFRTIIEKPAQLEMVPRNYCRYGIDPDIFRNRLLQHEKTDLVLVTSMMTYWYPGVFEAIKIIRDIMPGVPILLGGKYATLCHDHALAFSGADFVIPGRGEAKLLQIIQHLFGEKPLLVPDENDLDSVPYPAFDLIATLDQVPVTTSLGCPYRCSYCVSHLLQRKFLKRNPHAVADEIEYWHNHFGVTDFSFYDDALLVDASDMIIPLLSEIKKRGLRCRFHCPNGLHLREIDANISRLLYESGFKTIRFGFETSDFRLQRQTGGKVRNEELRRAVAALKSAGYRTEDIGIYLLCGIPGQKTAEVVQTVDFVLECGVKPVLTEYSPIPGTKMWDAALACSSFDIRHEPLYHNNSLLSCQNDDFTYEAYKNLKAELKTKLSGITDRDDYHN